MKAQECDEYRELLANGLADDDDSHYKDCEACHFLAATLRGAETMLRSEGVPCLPSGFAARAVGAALRGSKQAPKDSLLDRFFPVAIPAAALAVAAAVLLSIGVGWSPPTQEPLATDPVAIATQTPADLADPTPAILGVDE